MEKSFKPSSKFQCCEINVSYRPNFRASQRPRISSSQDAFDVLMECWDTGRIELQEQFKIILLNKANRVIGIFEVSSGGMSGTLADPKLIFATVLKCCACGIILAHNHPSGNLRPSSADLALTRKLKAAAGLLDIELHDHLIVCADGYLSLAEQMEEKMKANLPDFKLYDSVEATRGRVDLSLFFKQSGQSDYYYLNKFEVCHEKGQAIPEGQKVMVLTQTEGTDRGETKSFVHISEGIAFFNGQKEMLKEQKGISHLVVGRDPGSAVKLATMEDGKVNYVQKEFAQTYRTSPINQTIYLDKGKGFSEEQAVNLIQGRAVYRDDMVSQAGQQYKAWIKLDFDVPKDRFGNFMINQYTDPAYGFDLSRVLDKFEIKELGDPAKREILEGSIRNGNRAIVTVEKNGEPVKLELEAVPRYSQINLYTKEGRPEKREQFLKQPDIKQEYAQSRNKAQEKNKTQGQGLGV